MPYLCIKTVSITTCNVDNVKCWQKCLSIFILFLCRLYKKKCLSLFVYEYARFNGTAIVQNTKNSDVKKEGHSSVKRTGKRTLMRERGKYRSPSWQENDIKLNAPAWSVNPESRTGGDWSTMIYIKLQNDVVDSSCQVCSLPRDCHNILQKIRIT